VYICYACELCCVSWRSDGRVQFPYNQKHLTCIQWYQLENMESNKRVWCGTAVSASSDVDRKHNWLEWLSFRVLSAVSINHCADFMYYWCDSAHPLASACWLLLFVIFKCQISIHCFSNCHYLMKVVSSIIFKLGISEIFRSFLAFSIVREVELTDILRNIYTI